MGLMTRNVGRGDAANTNNGLVGKDGEWKFAWEMDRVCKFSTLQFHNFVYGEW